MRAIYRKRFVRAPEIGAARVLDREMIPLFVEGTMNVLKHHGIIAGPMGRTGKDVAVFGANIVTLGGASIGVRVYDELGSEVAHRWFATYTKRYTGSFIDAHTVARARRLHARCETAMTPK